MKNKFVNPRRKNCPVSINEPLFFDSIWSVDSLLNVLFILLSVGYLFEHIENHASNILEAIENGRLQGMTGMISVNAYVSADEEDALQVILADGSVILSEDAAEIFAEINQGRIIPFLRASSLQMMVSIIRKTQEIDRDQVKIAINGEDSVELAYGLFMISSFLNLIAVVVGSILIYWALGNGAGN